MYTYIFIFLSKPERVTKGLSHIHIIDMLIDTGYLHKKNLSILDSSANTVSYCQTDIRAISSLINIFLN